MKEIEKGKLIIIGSLGAIITTIIIILFFYYSDDSSSVEPGYGVEFAPSTISNKKKEFRTKLQAYEEKQKEKYNPVVVRDPFTFDQTQIDTLKEKEEPGGEPPKEVTTSVSKKHLVISNKKKVVDPEPQEKQRRRVGFVQKESTSNDDAKIYAVLKVRISKADKVKTGSLVYMRTIDAYKTSRGLIPSNTLITGTASLEGSRLFINVESVSVSNQTLASNLFAYDLQGNLGLPINASIENEITNEAINEGIDEASSALNIPIISSLGSNSLKKISNASTVEIHKGGKFILKTILK